MCKRIILWGGGKGYDAFVQLKGYQMVSLSAIVDKNKRCSLIDGIPVITPDELPGLQFDYLIVSVLDEEIFKDIVSDAVRIGIKRERIIPLRVFQIPFFDFDDYISILQSNISIVSDCCFAGLLYHRFGMRFTSPTINMFSDNENYFRFISDLENHFRLPMVEVDNWIDKPWAGVYSYPRGCVGDVEWCFNHDITFATALDRWQKGVKRFNWDNYLVIMTINSESMAYAFDDLRINKKIGFYWKDLGLKSVIYLPEWQSPFFRKKYDYCFSGYVNRIADGADGVRNINWFKVLLNKDAFIRVQY